MCVCVCVCVCVCQPFSVGKGGLLCAMLMFNHNIVSLNVNRHTSKADHSDQNVFSPLSKAYS